MKKNNILLLIINLSYTVSNFGIIQLFNTSSNYGLNGLGFTFLELQKLRDGSLEKECNNKINIIKKSTSKKNNTINELKYELNIINKAQKKILWHLKDPTIGIDIKNNYYPPKYPYLPHFFSLWDLAPHKGSGIKVASIDTGVAAFSLQNNENISLKKHRDLEMPIVLQNTYNIINQDGQNSITQLALILKQYIKNEYYDEIELEKNIPLWIIEYKKNGTLKKLKEYLKNKVTPNYLISALQEFVNGEYGIKQKFNFFLLNQLTGKTTSLIENLLPLAPIPSTKKLSLFMSHGSHTFGLIGANLDDGKITAEKGVVGIAPLADVFMIKAFQIKTMESDKATLMAAIKKSLDYDAQIINLSLKVSDQLNMFSQSTKQFNHLINKIPYAVAASGNNGTPQQLHYAGKVLGYPARFKSVPFTVGAYGIENNHAYIPHFSQYEPNVGPVFVAPGVDILSAGLLPNQKVDSAYLFLDGTSMACSIISGFVALMLGEFQNDFSREQLIATCYKSGVKLENNSEWRERTLLGALDMRTALFMLHVLKTIKNQNLIEDFNKNFFRLLDAIQLLLFIPINHFSESFLNNTSFNNAMLTYINKLEKKHFSLSNYYIPYNQNKKEALKASTNYITKIIELILKPNNKNSYNIINPYIHEKTLEKINFILKDPRYSFSFVKNKTAEKLLQEKIAKKRPSKY